VLFYFELFAFELHPPLFLADLLLGQCKSESNILIE
jgi:hypothetical protein